MNEPKILLFDIESLPDLKELFKVIPNLGDYPGLTLKASINSVICFGYKWLNDPKTHVINAWDFKPWSKDVNSDKSLLMAAYDVIKEADVLVTHNGKRFDHKFIQTRLLKYDLPPLPKMMHIDTCAVAKSNLLMFNNRLNTLSKFMTSEEKLENGGWDLWAKVLNRHEPSMRLMSKYCAQDVVTLEAVFKKLRPFIKLPNYNMYKDHEKEACPNCGSTKVRSHGRLVRSNHISHRQLCISCGTSFTLKKEKPVHL